MSDQKDTRLIRRDGRELLEVPRLRARVLRGADKGAEIELGEKTFAVIGSHPDCDLVLTDPAVSRRHVELSLGPTGYVVQDLGSKNGILVGGLRIQRATLDANVSAVSIGSTEIELALGVGTSLTHELSGRDRFGSVLGSSAPMRALFAALEKSAAIDSTVLLEGESGTGKEVIAESLHRASPRAAGPFVVVDCGAIARGLVASELFGHERGAFTGADARRIGAFESASGGTLFIDEIGELPLDLQPVFLRAIESREIRRVGGDGSPIKVDVRIIAATHRNLASLVEQKLFRADLYYRLAVVKLWVPALRERREDIPLLAEHFVARLRREETPSAEALTPAVLGALTAHDWPGNVRELRNAIERLLALGELATPIRERPNAQNNVPEYQAARRDALDRFEAEYCRAALAAAGSGGVARAAAIAGLSRQMMYRLMQRHDIPTP